MTPYGFWPPGTGGTPYGGYFMPGTFSASGFGMNPGMGIGAGFPGSFQPGFGPGMGFAGNFPPGFGSFYPGTYQPGFNMPPNMGMGFPGNFQPGFGPGVGPYFAGAGTAPEAMYPTQFNPTPMDLGWGLGGSRRWGGSYSPQYTMTGLPTDDEIVEMVYDSIDNDPLIPYDADINVDADAGTVMLTGNVTTKQIKHAAGDDAWWIPGVDDVHNELNVERRHPAHAAREETTETRRPARATAETGTGMEGQAQQPGITPTPRAARRGGTRR